MKSAQLPSVLVAVSMLATGAARAQTVATTDPVGFATVNVVAGTGVAKRNTYFSLPLLEPSGDLTGQTAGTITGVASNTISNSNAGWEAGELSQVASPHLIMVTSGAAKGRMFLVSTNPANTETTVAVSKTDTVQVPDLTTLGIIPGRDTYKIFSCDTLASFFGTPESSGVQGGTSVKTADSIALVVNGSSSVFYYDTGKGRWTRASLGNPDASHTPLPPYYGMAYQRLGNTPLSFSATGAVPTTQRQVSVKNSGTTVLAHYWPMESTLLDLGIQNLDGWTSGPNAKIADTVLVTTAGSVSTYYHDGTDWRRVSFGNPLGNSAVIPVGSSIILSKRGSATGLATLTQGLPYSL